MDLTRRKLIVTALGVTAGFTASTARAEEFWNKKDPSAWSTDEVVLLTTDSPWAHDIRLDVKSKGQAVAQDSIDAVRDPTSGGFRGGSAGGRTKGKPANAIVSWESAEPLFDALKYKLPADFVNHYVIGIKDLPIVVEAGPDRQSPEQLTDWLKNSATLQAKGRDPVQAGLVATSRGGSMVLFGFLKELLPLSRSDKEVLFLLDTNQLALKARFQPKEMVYKGKLAL